MRIQSEFIIKIEEYIPLKVVSERNNEPINYVSYSKDNTSLIEFAVGMDSKKLYAITLLLCKDYLIADDTLLLPTAQKDEIIFDGGNKNCSYFMATIYSDGVKIVLSEENSYKYIKMDRLYYGISKTNEIVEIGISNMCKNEIEHIKKELEIAYIFREL